MKMSGTAMDWLGRHRDYKVTDCVITEKMLLIDWTEADGSNCHLKATSRDGGQTYQGLFGGPLPQPWGMELTRYEAFKGGETLLMGGWQNGSEMGTIAFRLEPRQESPKRR